MHMGVSVVDIDIDVILLMMMIGLMIYYHWIWDAENESDRNDDAHRRIMEYSGEPRRAMWMALVLLQAYCDLP